MDLWNRWMARLLFVTGRLTQSGWDERKVVNMIHSFTGAIWYECYSLCCGLCWHLRVSCCTLLSVTLYAGVRGASVTSRPPLHLPGYVSHTRQRPAHKHGRLQPQGVLPRHSIRILFIFFMCLLGTVFTAYNNFLQILSFVIVINRYLSVKLSCSDEPEWLLWFSDVHRNNDWMCVGP